MCVVTREGVKKVFENSKRGKKGDFSNTYIGAFVQSLALLSIPSPPILPHFLPKCSKTRRLKDFFAVRMTRIITLSTSCLRFISSRNISIHACIYIP